MIDGSNHIMCGIIIIIGDGTEEFTSTSQIERLIDKRGPDYKTSFQDFKTKCSLKLRIKASILHLRGDELAKQPVIDEQANVLIFNGQIYRFRGDLLNPKISDTLFLASKLASCDKREDVVQVVSLIDGPFAFVFWHNKLNSLFYCRDLFGRKSLCKLIGNKNYPAILSSVCDPDITAGVDSTWSEVQSGRVHCILFDDNGSFCNKYIYPLDIDRVYPPTSRCNITTNDLAQIEPTTSIASLLKPLNTNITTECNEQMNFQRSLDILKIKLMNAISIRINHNWTRCLTCRRTASSTCNHSKLAVAFSGGIDSTLLALLIDKVYPVGETIDLVTVAFKSNSPDRCSAAVAFRELKELCPQRHWKLVACDVSLVTLQETRSTVIRHLIAPCNTVIDDSVGCACWFIGEARGRVFVDSGETSVEKFLDYKAPEDNSTASNGYVSPATMLFVGSGIDEQLGGYSSHKSAWMNSRKEGLIEEISFLMRRISSRNMGRDDRVYSHHGRDVKIPYLDFELVSFLNELPIDHKMNLDESQNWGPKKLLRVLAFNLGLEKTSKQVKRALQFGTRIANLEDCKEKGNQICSRLIKHSN